jgi:hypothetical protein
MMEGVLVVSNWTDGSEMFQMPLSRTPDGVLLIPRKKDRVVIEGISYTVWDIEWDMTEQRVRVLAK